QQESVLSAARGGEDAAEVGTGTGVLPLSGHRDRPQEEIVELARGLDRCRIVDIRIGEFTECDFVQMNRSHGRPSPFELARI
ncbi:MAG: hypothetical protein KAH46_11010, partial [Mycobacterium sp.]|nr:hypothetical protein [Mycobacterium sp.]